MSTASNKNSNQAVLGKGSKVEGTLTFTGPAQLTGAIEGEINSQDLLEIGEGAEIKAKVNGTEIIVRGAVHGDIDAKGKLSLLKPASVFGNIKSGNLIVEEGVVFEGSCTMSTSNASSSASSSALSLKKGAAGS